jgi:hypothetical protein
VHSPEFNLWVNGKRIPHSVTFLSKTHVKDNGIKCQCYFATVISDQSQYFCAQVSYHVLHISSLHKTYSYVFITFSVQIYAHGSCTSAFVIVKFSYDHYFRVQFFKSKIYLFWCVLLMNTVSFDRITVPVFLATPISSYLSWRKKIPLES